MRLSDYTTLRLGGRARRFVRAGTEEDLIKAVRAADDGGEPTLILGGGSNLVVADEGFDGTVIQVATKGVDPGGEPGLMTVAAGEDWDAATVQATTASQSSPAGTITRPGAPCWRMPLVATWMTVPSNPSSATTRLLPPPRISIGSPPSSAARTASIRSSSVPAATK